MKTQRIKELNEMVTKEIKVATPLQRLKSRIVNIILDNRFITLTVYLLAFLFTILFSIEL
tara:strand:+ start:358 stop:537 length:180 start_codon:yes stop_codon:yes gene_type:complete